MNWDTQLNKEIDLLLESTRKFAATEIAPIADEIDQKNEFRKRIELVRQIAVRAC